MLIAGIDLDQRFWPVATAGIGVIDSTPQIVGQDCRERTGETTVVADQVLAKNPGNLTDEAQMSRQDLRETFEAMYRYAERGRDPRFPEVAAFARSVVELLEAPNTTASFSPSRASGQV